MKTASTRPAAQGDRTRSRERYSGRRSTISDYDALCNAIGDLAEDMRDLQQQAASEYKPVVDDILNTGNRDVRHIEHTLDRLLGF